MYCDVFIHFRYFTSYFFCFLSFYYMPKLIYLLRCEAIRRTFIRLSNFILHFFSVIFFKCYFSHIFLNQNYYFHFIPVIYSQKFIRIMHLFVVFHFRFTPSFTGYSYSNIFWRMLRDNLRKFEFSSRIRINYSILQIRI